MTECNLQCLFLASAKNCCVCADAICVRHANALYMIIMIMNITKDFNGSTRLHGRLQSANTTIRRYAYANATTPHFQWHIYTRARSFLFEFFFRLFFCFYIFVHAVIRQTIWHSHCDVFDDVAQVTLIDGYR